MKFTETKTKELFYNILKLFIALIAAFFSAFALSADRSAYISGIIDFINSINGNSIQTFCVFILVFLLFLRILNNPPPKRAMIASIVCAVILSFCETIGYNIADCNEVFNSSMTIYVGMFNGIVFLGFFSIVYGLLAVVFGYIMEHDLLVAKKITKFKLFTGNAISIFTVAAVLMLMWSFYYRIFYPAIVTWDTYYQINQGLGFSALTDENPFLHTLFLALIVKLGRALFGTINSGVALFALVQMTFIAFMVSFVINYMARRKIPVVYRLFTFAFYALHPVIAAYSITLWKDVWMATFILVYVVFLIEICTNADSFFKSKLYISGFILIILAIFFAKGTGIIMVVFSLPFVFFFAKKHWKKLLAATLICCTVFGIVRVVIIPMYNIEEGHIREPLSVPLQQIARTVKYHGDELTDEQRETIDEILPYDKLDELYDPHISDTVKGALDEEQFSADKAKYIKLWLELGVQYPKTYVESFLSNSYGYWYPETTYWQITDISYYDMLTLYKENNWTIFDENIDQYTKEGASERIKTIVKNAVNYNIRQIPVVSVFFSIGSYFWLALLCLAVCIMKKKYRLLSAFLPLIAVFIVCIFSPIFAEMRYAYPIVLAMPVIFAFTIFNNRSIASDTEQLNYSEEKIDEQNILPVLALDE